MSDPWAEFRTTRAFPDAAPTQAEQDAWAAYRGAPKPVNVARDVGKSFQTGAMQGSAGLIGGPGDLGQLITTLPVKAASALEKRGALPKGSADALAEQIAAHPPNEGIAGVGHGLAGAVLAKALRMTGESPDKIAAATNALPGGKTLLPTTQNIETAAGSPAYYHMPETVWGEYARTAGQFLPSALFPGSAGARVANVVVPALASETAGQATKGTKLEPWARIAGALAGGTAVTLATQPGPTTRMLAEASRGATDDQVRAATALRQEAASRGVDLTLPEALQQVTNNGTRMGTMQRVLEGTKSGSELTTPYMANRPEQVRQAVTEFADRLSPAAPDPYVLADNTRAAAGDVLTGVRQQINANARPWYDALQQEHLPSASPQYQALAQSPAYQEALSQVRANPILNHQIAQLPDNNLAVVNEVVKQLDTLAENARPNPASATGNAQLSAAYDAARNQADELASAVSEPWRLSRQMVASGREAFLTPLQAGPMGDLSRQAISPDVQAQTRALFPNMPAEGAAPATAQTLEMLPPDISRPLVRQHFMNAANEATQDLQSGQNQWGGAKLAALIAGNPEQERVLQAGVGAAGGDAADLGSLIEVLRATGKRQPQGSLTAYNNEELRNLGSMGTAGETAKTIASGPSMFRRFGEALQRAQMERNAEALAQAILADPATAEQTLLQARRAAPANTPITSLERLALTVAQSRQLPPPQQPSP